jgi:hypothetical protein
MERRRLYSLGATLTAAALVGLGAGVGIRELRRHGDDRSFAELGEQTGRALADQYLDCPGIGEVTGESQITADDAVLNSRTVSETDKWKYVFGRAVGCRMELTEIERRNLTASGASVTIPGVE